MGKYGIRLQLCINIIGKGGGLSSIFRLGAKDEKPPNRV